MVLMSAGALAGVVVGVVTLMDHLGGGERVAQHANPAADVMSIYDSFSESCINDSKWTGFVVLDGDTREEHSPDDVGCLPADEYGLTVADGRLRIRVTNPASGQTRNFYLLADPVLGIAELEIGFTIEDVRPELGAIGLQILLDEASYTWGEFLVLFDEYPSIRTGIVVLERYGNAIAWNRTQLEDVEPYSLGDPMRLGVRWDGQAVHLLVEGEEVATTPVVGYGDSFAIVCGIGSNRLGDEPMLVGYIDEVRIRYWK